MGPYLWSSGKPRSDGFVWDCGDLERDLLHPSDSGNAKVADQLLTFFMASDTTASWFLNPTLSGRGPRLSGITASPTGGQSPLAVEFTPAVQAAMDYFWSFGDGTFARIRNPRKTFYVDGAYDVRLTVTDRSGAWAHSSVRVDVGRTP